MGKKNPYIFTIGLDSRNINHVKVAGVLNELKRGKAQLIVEAVLRYLEEPEVSASVGLEEEMLRCMVKKFVSEEVEKAMEDAIAIQRDSVEDKMSTANLSLEGSMLELEQTSRDSIFNTLNAFRKSK